jgi:hypothetical protein
MHIQNVNIHLSVPGFGAALLSALAEFGSAPEAEITTAPTGKPVPPAIGEYWAGQGGIYAGLMRGRDGAPDYHLVLATDPKSVFTKRAIGTYGTEVEGAASDHDGLANTKAFAQAGSDLCREILALEIDGHSDFYLPSRIESRLLWCNVPELFEKEWYLTSTQGASNGAWLQGFFHGTQSNGGKKFEARARAVRRLIL